ncbi:MAG: hypothetical protein V1913_10265 [Fibrobacterota bacterium]
MVKKGLEVCSDCKDYPCTRFDAEKKGYDSFVTHKKVFANLDFIRRNGMGRFIEQQKIRMNILMDFLANYDDGRSKSLFCISCALLPLDKLQETRKFMDKLDDSFAVKEKNKQLKNRLQMIAETMDIQLRLNNKK